MPYKCGGTSPAAGDCDDPTAGCEICSLYPFMRDEDELDPEIEDAIVYIVDLDFERDLGFLNEYPWDPWEVGMIKILYQVRMEAQEDRIEENTQDRERKARGE